MGGTADALRARRRPLRCSRQHPGGHGIPARDARPLRIAGFPGGLQCRPPPLRTASRGPPSAGGDAGIRSEEHTSELQSLMRNSYAVFCLQKKKRKDQQKKKKTNTTIIRYNRCTL